MHIHLARWWAHVHGAETESRSFTTPFDPIDNICNQIYNDNNNKHTNHTFLCIYMYFMNNRGDASVRWKALAICQMQVYIHSQQCNYKASCGRQMFNFVIAPNSWETKCVLWSASKHTHTHMSLSNDNICHLDLSIECVNRYIASTSHILNKIECLRWK